MSKNPLINALAATAYITFIGLVMNWGTSFAPKHPGVLAPIAVISLFTLSAAIMGYVFCYQPAMLYFDGKKKAAIKLFLQTVLIFGCITAVLLALLFTGILS